MYIFEIDEYRYIVDVYVYIGAVFKCNYESEIAFITQPTDYSTKLCLYNGTMIKVK